MAGTRTHSRELNESGAALLRRLLIVTLAAAFALMLAACTSGGSDNTSPLVAGGIVANPTAVNLGSSQNSATVVLSSLVAAPPSVTGVGASTAWLTATAASTDANGLGSYTIGVDRTGLLDGDYSGAVTFDLSSGDSITVIVTMRVIFTISGTITAAATTAVDSDLNDPFAPFTPNDDFPIAQPLGTPAIVNGFVSLSGTGILGDRFQSIGDEYDYYSVHLLAGQYVSLRVADFLPDSPAAVDVDVVLYDSTQKFVDTSQNIFSEFESVLVKDDGDYYIAVRGYSGSSKYVLNIGSTSLAPTAAAGGIPADFVPDQAIVKYKPQAGSATISAINASPGIRLSHRNRSRPALLRRDKNTALATILRALGGATGGPGAAASPARQAFEAGLDDESRRKLETLRLIKQLNAMPGIEYAEPNYIRRPLFTPNDPYYPFQLHYPQIRLPQAWDITNVSGAGTVIVAVVDTGVFLAHEDLAGQLVPGYDFISSATNARDGDGIDANPDDPGDSSIGASSWHGTHVTGTIAAASNNGIGVTGIARDARVMPLRVLGELGGTDYDINQALRYAAGLSNDSGTVPAQTADIVNLSLGGAGFSQASQNLYTELYTRGIIVIAAAGNENSSVPSYPAAYDNVVSVSALDYQNQRAPYSNFGPSVDVAAPGGNASVDRDGNGYPDGVLSTLVDDTTGTRDDSYAFYQGTSMAAPHVAGVAALMKWVYPGLIASEFDTLLASGDLTVDAGTSGRDDIYGYGVIDALKAVQAALAANNTPIAGTVLASPTFVDLGANLPSASLTLVQVGASPPTVTGYSDDAAWLSVTAPAAPDGIGDYSVAVDRSGLADASYRGTVSFSLSDGDTIAVDIVMQVRNTTGGQTGDTGYLYILLVDPLTYATIDQVDLGATDGAYAYQFDDVVAGSYYIVGGSDIDNDGFICDIGESCGSYPILNEFFLLDISSSRSDIDFISNVISGVTNRTGAIAGAPVEGFKLMPGTDRTRKTVGFR